MNIKPNTHIFNKQGQTISLVKEMGRGGEGSVYETKEFSNLVAKIYHKPIAPNKADKLSLMVNSKTERLLKLSAWPVDTLYEKPGGNIIGFLMQKVTGYKEIHNLYSPKSRLNLFPKASWQFLLHAATNVARAFSVIHEHGHVVADVNHANILVSKEATVFLIDCDSFQINTPQRTFLCEVGTSTHTPPELQDKTFREVPRNQNHDLFGLGVIIFQLLFMGRHPFAGKYLGSGDMPIEKAIKEYRFAYSANNLLTKMNQPPATLSLSNLSPYLIQLFEQSFSKSLLRPAAKDWVAGLSEIATSVKRCENTSSHLFYKNLSSCPWCDIEAKSGISLFNIQISGVFQAFKPSSNISKLWLELQAIQSPKALPQLPNKNSITTNPSTKAANIRNLTSKEIKISLTLSITFLFIATIVLYVLNLNIFISLIIVILLLKVLDLVINKTTTDTEVTQLKKTKEDIEKNLQKLSQSLQKTGDKEFSIKIREAEKSHEIYDSQINQKKQEYDKLPVLRKQKLDQIEIDNRKNQRVYQLNNFLDQHRIINAKISGIGKTRKATLQSYGIETAADISRTKIKAIPGFGNSYTSNLLDWRNSVEAQFIFDPTKIQSIPQTRIAILDKEIKDTQLSLQKEILKIETQHEKELLDAIAKLNSINQETEEIRKKLYPIALEDLKSLVQMETDLNFIGVDNFPFQILKTLSNPSVVLILILLLSFSFVIDYNRRVELQHQQEVERAKHLKEIEAQKLKQSAYQNKIKTQLFELGDDSKTVKEMFGEPIKVTNRLSETGVKQEEIWKYFPSKKGYLLNIGFNSDKIMGWVDKRKAQEAYSVSKEIVDNAENTINQYNTLKNILVEYGQMKYKSTFDRDLAVKIVEMKNIQVGNLFLSYNQDILPSKLVELQNCFVSAKTYLQQNANKTDERIHLPYSTTDVTLYTPEQTEYLQKLEDEIFLFNELTIIKISEAETIFNEFKYSSNLDQSTLK